MKRVISIAVELMAAIPPHSGRAALRNGKIRSCGRKLPDIEFIFEAQIFSRVERSIPYLADFFAAYLKE
jgi:hypothetical protein